MRLIADDKTVVVRPLDPRAEVIEMELGERIAVIAFDAGKCLAIACTVARVAAALAEQLAGELLNVVAVPVLKRGGELGRPARVVVFERIVKLSANQTTWKTCKRLVERREILPQRCRRVRIHD